jgi:hypothetical protein
MNFLEMKELNLTYATCKYRHLRPDVFKYHIPENCGYGRKFEYNVYLNSLGVSGSSVEYAQTMCKHKWGWWFDKNKMVNMSFQDPTEMIMWTLKCYHKQRRDNQ